MAGTIPENVIWIGEDGSLPAADEHERLEVYSQMIAIHNGDVKDAGEYVPECYQVENALEIQKATNGSWVYVSGNKDDVTSIHQSVVVASQLRVMPDFKAWDSFTKDMETRAASRFQRRRFPRF